MADMRVLPFVADVPPGGGYLATLTPRRPFRLSRLVLSANARDLVVDLQLGDRVLLVDVPGVHFTVHARVADELDVDDRLERAIEALTPWVPAMAAGGLVPARAVDLELPPGTLAAAARDHSLDLSDELVPAGVTVRVLLRSEEPEEILARGLLIDLTDDSTQPLAG